MGDRLYRVLKYTAIAMVVLWVGWSIYDNFFVRSEPGEYAYHAGTNYFADGNYQKALEEYQAALQERPDNLHAMRGSAEALIMLGQEREAIEIYDQLIATQPNNAGHYANRGIAHDRLGEYEKAVLDYERSLAFDPELAEGPGWLTRFFRKQAEKPPGILERAQYIRQQLALPPGERVLQDPEQDQVQRPYKK